MRIDLEQQRGFFTAHEPWSNRLLGLALHALALNYTWRPKLRRLLHSCDGPLDFTVVWRTEANEVAQTIRVAQGRFRVSPGIHPAADCQWIFRDSSALRAILSSPPSEVLLALLRSEMRIEGNLSVASALNFLLSAVLQAWPRPVRSRQDLYAAPTGVGRDGTRDERLKLAPEATLAVLDDPGLSAYTLDDFPRLSKFLRQHFSTPPALCPERARDLTRWYRKHGFEQDENGRPWIPELRQAHAFAAMLSSKTPRLRPDDLLAGTTTSKDVGVVVYPDAHGTLIWGELLTAAKRPLNPYQIETRDAACLHHEVFPFWLRRNFREWVREHHAYPTGQRIEERFSAYFNWKTVALSHTIPDFPSLLAQGTSGLRARIKARYRQQPDSAALQAMLIVLDGLECYADNLAAEVATQAQACSEPGRREELLNLAALCRCVPRQPARTLHEALQSAWTLWIALHLENTNAGLSLGRMDQWLQPYFLADSRKLSTAAERQAYVHQAIELVGCFFLRCADHLPLVPDIGNYLFGGSSSDQAITLGGVTADGRCAVNDMSYVLLKVTEMLKLRDPNVNARYHHQRNSDSFLHRLCEVNLITRATPSIHGDANVITALRSAGYPAADAGNWSAVGCVEPTLTGQHMGHTGCLMFNLVTPLELALHGGHHPLLRCQLGPDTGLPVDFDAFYQAFLRHLRLLAGHATDYNAQLGEAHRMLRPTPLLSSLIGGCIQTGRDATAAGARFNSSGVACIGLADVVDSLLAIQHLVYLDRHLDLPGLRRILAVDFAGHDPVLALIRQQVPRFGSGDTAALELARRLTHDVHVLFAGLRNYRGGPYWAGFWSMSNHVAFGSLSGALPSGRRAGKAFSPGLTPSPQASDNLLDNLLDVAQLDPADLVNNVAFNVKYVPSTEDGHRCRIEHMAAYTKAYIEQGGMQMQFNVVSSATLRDAVVHPENYRDLLVRISGYNAYFVTLNPDMQRELIERAEYAQ